MLDIILRNGTVIDGSGNPGYKADVAIKNGKIVKIGVLADQSATYDIDVQQSVIAPGFIDIHTHSDALVFAPQRDAAKVLQGITTEVIGNCGMSAAPVTADFLELQKRYTAPIFGRFPLSWQWRSLADYLQEIEDYGVIGNIVPLVGHGTIRIAVMGFADRAPSVAELSQMKALVSAAMDDGAFGLSSGLIYPPGLYSKTDEMIELCQVVAEKGGIYATHLRNESALVIDALQEAITVAQTSGVPLQVSHHKVAGAENWGKSVQTLALIEQAHVQGLDITYDTYPYTAGNTYLLSLLPPWANEGGIDKMLARLEKEEFRSKIRKQIKEGLPGWENLTASAGGYHNIFISSCRDRRLEGRNIEQIAQEMALSPEDTILQILADNEGDATMIIFVMAKEEVARFLQHPLGMIASDAMALPGKPHPRFYGTFPRIIEKYVMHDKLLTLPDAVRKMSAMPAQKLGLTDRGLIKPGMAADIVVFDPGKVKDKATYADPQNTPEGINYVLVNGSITVREGKYTGMVSGQVLRKG